MIETERLILREYTMDDFDALYGIVSDPETMKHYPVPFDAERTRRWIAWNLDNYEKYGFGLWAVVLKRTGEFIGDCGITLQNIDGEMLPEIGYHIHKRYWRQGFAKEAARAARDWAFQNTGYDALYSYMKYTNVGSYSTALANGMRKIKEYPDPKNAISCAYAITRAEWEALKRAELTEARVDGVTYHVLRLLGHGKGGYSYLAEGGGRQVVLKQIHHEPCDYYSFGNKLEAELRDYDRLRRAGIRIPEMIAVDEKAERIVKEYVEGPVIFELIRDGADIAPYVEQVRQMAAQARQHGLNIDYFPTNFVVRDGLIWYVDYECNDYMEEWSFENWGVKYWSRTPEFDAWLLENGAGGAT